MFQLQEDHTPQPTWEGLIQGVGKKGPFSVGEELLPQVEEFKFLGVLSTSERKMEWEIGSVGIDAKPVHCGEERVEPKGEALSLPIFNRNPHP